LHLTSTSGLPQISIRVKNASHHIQLAILVEETLTESAGAMALHGKLDTLVALSSCQVILDKFAVSASR